MADMHDPCGQDSDSSTESASDTEINNAEEDNTIINKNGKTLVKSKTFDFLTVDFGPDNDDNNMPGTPVNKGKKKKKKANLQESFMKFKKEKQVEFRHYIFLISVVHFKTDLDQIDNENESWVKHLNPIIAVLGDTPPPLIGLWVVDYSYTMVGQ